MKMIFLRTSSKICTYLRIPHVRNMCKTLKTEHSKTFETVFSLPSIKYISMLNRLKVYHLAGTSIALPTSGVLEMVNIFPDHTFLSASYIGVTAAVLLSLATYPFRNVIGFLYISEDNKEIKISHVDFWGKRVDKIVPADDWIPFMDMSPKFLDSIYLSPQLADGTKYKLLARHGIIINAKKFTEVLE